MPDELFAARPRLYRWLLPFGVAATLAAFALGAWAMIGNVQHNQERTAELRRTAAALKQQNASQQATIRELCNRGYLINQAFTILGAQLRVPADRAALASVQGAIVADLLDPRLPCARP